MPKSRFDRLIRKAKPTEIAFIDSSKIAVCYNLRIPQHQVFDDVAEREHGSMEWFYSFKLHLIINDEEGLLLKQFRTIKKYLSIEHTDA